MTLAAISHDLGALRRDMAAVLAGLGALTDAVTAQGALLSLVLEAVNADEPDGSGLVEALIRIATALENQGAEIEAMRLALTALPGTVRGTSVSVDRGC